jgi:hypothetical protein
MEVATSDVAVSEEGWHVNHDGQSTADDVLAGIDLTGKRFLVTGASAGLGVEPCRALVARGLRSSALRAIWTRRERRSAALVRAASTSFGSILRR